MTVNLVKGQNTPLNSGLTKVRVGLGWDPRVEPGIEFDLDASAFLLGADSKVRGESDFIFYNHPQSACGSVVSSGDNRTGEGDGDDETILVDLSRVPADVERIVFTATIYEAIERNQNFGMVDSAFIRLVDDSNGEEQIRFELTEDACINSALVFGELYRRNGAWKFRALGQGFDLDLAGLARKFGVRV
ncbi:MAG: TerD family protein [Thermoguttaceae bacterium]|nr:TerD family protein [Thermoguttaceae bacterium]